MFFNKEKIYMGSFIRGIASEILAIKPYTFADYLQNDTDEILSQEEFEAFNEQIPLLQNLILFAIMLEAVNNGKINYSPLDLGMTYAKAFSLAAEDHNIPLEEVNSLYDKLLSEMNEYLGYLVDVSDEEFAKNSYGTYMCMYFGSRFSFPADNYDKRTKYVILVNNQKKIMQGYFKEKLSRVKIIG